MESKQKYKVLGMMSGTSLDGLDLAFCTFEKKETGWVYEIQKAQTVTYNPRWLKVLGAAHDLTAEKLIELDVNFGKLLGESVRHFISQHKVSPDFIASHGHTVFHQPGKGFTYQIGNGNAIHAVTGFPVVCDFRSLDVLLGGEGAPLVPAGDKILFHEFDVCLNLGGIANLSTDVKGKRIAFDICYANMGLNHLAGKAGKKFDKNGALSAEGEINKVLLRKLETVYKKYRTKRPSLGREGFEKDVRRLLDEEKIPLGDRLRTFTESTAGEIISAILELRRNAKVMCTGGGAFNSFLISRMLELGGDDLTLVIPDEEVVKFKEAMVFAFLGLLRVRDEVNCLKSVTRASRDSSSGILVGF
jgi:anhydro-N-acetylmuramic acid kinase